MRIGSSSRFFELRPGGPFRIRSSLPDFLAGRSTLSNSHKQELALDPVTIIPQLHWPSRHRVISTDVGSQNGGVLNNSPEVLDTDDDVEMIFLDMEAAELIACHGNRCLQWFLQDLWYLFALVMARNVC